VFCRRSPPAECCFPHQQRVTPSSQQQHSVLTASPFLQHAEEIARFENLPAVNDQQRAEARHREIMAQFGVINTRLDGYDRRFDDIDRRFDRIETSQTAK
jgi:hypothetical protein